MSEEQVPVEVNAVGGSMVTAVTKKEIVKEISEKLDLTQLKVKDVVQMTFDAVTNALVKHGRIELRNFGVFEVKQRAARKARNPRTGEKVFVPAKFVVTFKPGKEMEERVRELDRRAARRNAASGDDGGGRPSPRPGPLGDLTSSSSYDTGQAGTG